MFLKPLKIKSNHQLKVSDKKHLKDEFRKSFPSLTDPNLDELLPKKELVSMMKIETSSHLIVQVYVVNKRAVAFMHEGKLFPTIYLLWQYPNIMLTFTTHTAVLSKLVDGAHLMLPGVNYPILNSPETPAFLGNAAACVNLMSNKAAVAVGVTAQSSKEMIRSENRGKCVIVYHVLGDKLCTLENLPCLAVPDQGCPDWITQRSNPIHIENIREQGDSNIEELNEIDRISPDLNAEDFEEETASAAAEPTAGEMDELFCNCFLSAIKYSKDLTLPVLTSTFYKVFMIPACPSGKTLDVKKTSYKKLSQFLQSMTEVGIIKVEEQKKGVDNISEINREHPMVVIFNLAPADRPVRPAKGGGDENVQPSVLEAHCVTAMVLPVFAEFGFTKGSVITNSEIRKYVTEYVKRHNLQNENKNYVNSNDVLKAVHAGERLITWQLLMEKIYKAMTPCFKVTCGDTTVIRKGKLEAINITVAKRTGNKKVTLVDNVEVYGINIDELASYCRNGVAASTSINRSQTIKKTDQLQIQGNQVLFIYNLLIEKYKVPKRYIRGLEFAPKKKH